MFAAPGYEQSVQNLRVTSLDSDMVFSDAERGITLTLNVGV